MVHDRKKIPLTNIESLLIKQLLLSDRRVCSKAELILCIHRDPAHYRGLEMCLSRLQEKFSTFSNGERLLRSVRNRGYCLIQRIKVS
ncbi:helix-turn-helix domain-containing protein [Pseudomonas sp. MH9.2]|uniref:helix-turn-helix domain-containing protein n=1 Tax=Pseudomonas sp. MH9.2 TaxID=3048629 RepID=UPI002B2321DD|nr:helix-turn-helix domain-containing protein [Pseudomonas sp. MH9.2]MEB0029053.1 helix-turn-helix domain-containing protein [Pseudomonas sp. MH9.2]MEB0150578.1 helix-turn-helix domain-containing protein [Pseudomonas sp. CCC2.2]MEE3509599.1 helix-turn-helix domain-containing protein [Pseudomonas sp. 10C3]